jgi:hypothetical protein
MAPGEQEVVNLIVTERHYIHVKTWREAGDWHAQIMVDGSLKALENLGPDAPPPPPTPLAAVPIKKNKKRR